MSASERPISDPCAGCVKRRPDGNYSWDCLECKRWWPDKYESSANAREHLTRSPQRPLRLEIREK